MRYLVLATDYDGTIARSGKVEAAALAAIERLRTSGRRTILLTGRRLDDLLAVCRRVSLFDYIVTENGAVIYQPRTREQVLLGKQPSAAFVNRLRELTEDSIDTGHVIISTRVPHQGAVLQAIQWLGC